MCTTQKYKEGKGSSNGLPIDGPNNSIAGGTNMTKDDQLNLAFGITTKKPQLSRPIEHKMTQHQVFIPQNRILQ